VSRVDHNPAVLERIRTALDGVPARIELGRDGSAVVHATRADVHALLERLRDRAGFETATFVTALDHSPASPRFELCWQLLSLAHQDRVRVQVRLQERDARVPSCTDLWPGTAYMERECYDMFGVVFEGHDGLERLLMPAEFEHHPLRKDFPHQGIEPDALYRRWERERRAEEEARG